MTRRKSKVGKWAKDYPVFIVLLIVLIIGIWLGFNLAQKISLQKIQPESKKRIATQTVKKEKQIRIQPAPISKPSKPASQPASFFKGFFGGFGQREVKITPVPGKKEKPKIFFIIDDCGNSRKNADLLFSIDRPLTIAVLPQLRYSQFFVQEGNRHGFLTILHLPMEPESVAENPGPGLLKVGMSPDEVRGIINADLESVRGVSGVNNHMGSKATRDPVLMSIVAQELKERNLFFIDSFTHSKSIAYVEAEAMGVSTFKRDVFIDNEDDYEKIKAQIENVARIAGEKGRAIAIGHIRANTLRAIKDMIPELEARGFELTNFNAIMNKKS